jgi:hypothetical protein
VLTKDLFGQITVFHFPARTHITAKPASGAFIQIDLRILILSYSYGAGWTYPGTAAAPRAQVF